MNNAAQTPVGAPAFRARLRHRLAMHVPADLFCIRTPKPLVSFTFDDAPKSSKAVGAQLLGECNAKATYYISGSLVGTRTVDWETLSADDIRALADDGHEIGCHTFSHLRVSDNDLPDVEADVERNAAFFRAHLPGVTLENFAYPYGYGSLTTKQRFRSRFHSGRSIIPGVNHGRIDLQFLRSTPLIDAEIGPAGIEKALDMAIAKSGWLIFYTHDVALRPSAYGCSPALLAYAIASARRRDIECVTVREGLQRIGASTRGMRLAI